MLTRPPVNTQEQLKRAAEEKVIPQSQAVGLLYLPYVPREGMANSCWYVVSPFFKTDERPGNPWYNKGNKTFLFQDRATAQEALVQAQAWCAEQYHIHEWKRNSTGDYVPAIVQQKCPIPRPVRGKKK